MNSAKLATPVSDEDHAQGPADAVITWVQYGDFECPYTRLSQHSVHQLQREFSGRLRFVFWHFPLEDIHPHARGTDDDRSRGQSQRAAASLAKRLGALSVFWRRLAWVRAQRREHAELLQEQTTQVPPPWVKPAIELLVRQARIAELGEFR
jgi:protein-disulfide isomerase